jgi:hypothetical protein
MKQSLGFILIILGALAFRIANLLEPKWVVCSGRFSESSSFPVRPSEWGDQARSDDLLLQRRFVHF